MNKARMTKRRYNILKLIAKGYNNEEIAKEMNLSLCNIKLQKWKLYCHLNIHTQNDAILVGLQIGYLLPNDLKIKNKSKIIRILKECKNVFINNNFKNVIE